VTGAVRDAVAALLSDHPQERAGQGWDKGWDKGWDEDLGRKATAALTDAGWLGVGLPEPLGGEGGELADVAEVIDAVSCAGWPSPVADVVLVAHGLLAHAGLVQPSPVVVAVPAIGEVDDGAVSVAAEAVPWAPWARHLLVLTAAGSGSAVHVVEADVARLRVRPSLSGTPAADVLLDRVEPVANAPVPDGPGALLDLAYGLGALVRGIQSRAALRRVLDLTIAHVRTRRQFGRLLSAFQAVQQHLAVLAGEVATVEAAVAALTDGVPTAAAAAVGPRLATMRVRVADAAGEAARLAHQLHGAMGVTREYELHRHTLALLAWREEFGTRRDWATRLAAAAVDADDLWRWLLDEHDET
jgi:acyl-CoA dehydrogenase